MKEHKQIFNINGKEIEVSTGKIAIQAQGSILLKMGGTTLFATASVDSKDTDLDYFPLGVEYIEKMYARGVMSGSKYKKREGLPTDEAIIKARQVDHSVRSLFPKSFKRPVSVVLTVLSYDGENDPEVLAVLGSSLALMQTGIPFYGPCSSVVACVDKEGKVIINPAVEIREQFDAEFVISAVDGKILNLEGWAKEVSDETMDKIMDESLKVIEDTNKQQREFIEKTGKTLQIDASLYTNKPAGEELINKIIENDYEEIKNSMKNETKIERNPLMTSVRDEIVKKYATEESGYSEFEVSMAVDYVQRKALREGVMKEETRVSGRALDEIREISGEIDVLPTVHGSALFTRGLTQSLSIVTLGSKSDELMIDDMEGESSKTFMHHYNMPGYANGEAGRFNYHPGRREIGHGAIGENALKNMLPSQEEFPYTIRAVSEITSSNGSTSMAATCASSLALMAAGVPMKEAVAGIGVGLVTEDGNEDNYKLLLDIEGIEDFYGDMDFKVCGTRNGITAIQYENKLMGVPLKIMKEAIRLANKGRQHVLEEMNKIISQPKEDLAQNAPRIEQVKIPVDRIGELIGPGGKNIKDLIARTEQVENKPADISIEEDGTVSIATASKAQMEFAKKEIENAFREAKIGDIFEGKVAKIVEFGAFVDVSPSISGLVHKSEMADKFVKDPKDVVKEGQMVKVKVIKKDNGKISFTMKGIEQ